MKKSVAFLLCLLTLGIVLLASCGRSREDRTVGLQVVTTLFPLYDFARNVGGDKAHVTLLLPPGVEPHGFEPRPRDILLVNRADIFIYTGSFMEPWAADIVKGADAKRLVVVDASAGATLQRETNGPSHESDAHVGASHQGEAPPAPGSGTGEGPVDPHIWLDLGNAQKIVDNICAGFVRRDPGNRQFYEKNAEGYKAGLARLDARFKDGLSECRTRVFVHGGHYAFDYLARRYRLTYVSAYGFSPNSEPGPKHLAEMVHTIREQQTKYVFYEELLQPRVAETLARETGVRLLPLNGGHNVSAEQMEKGATFISLLEQDLENLRVGLQCR